MMRQTKWKVGIGIQRRRTQIVWYRGNGSAIDGQTKCEFEAFAKSERFKR